MKKTLRKLGGFLLTLCVAVSCLAFPSHAANGELQFSDPSGEAGARIEVRVKVISDSEPIGSYEIKATYNTSVLRLEDSPGVTAEDGTLTITSQTDGTETQTLQTMTFTALNEGVSTIDVISYKAAVTSGEEMDLTLGSSTVTISGGTPVTEEPPARPPRETVTVDVDGVPYTVNTEFMEKDVPMGFKATDAELNGTVTRAMVLEKGDRYMYYLKNSAGESSYFLYDEQSNTFTLTEPVMVNNQLTLFLMDHTPTAELPEKFWPTTMTINGKEFNIWNNMDNQDYYLVYALNSEGAEGYYEYDSQESTYQRMNMLELEVKEEPDVKPEVHTDSKLIRFFKENLKPILIVLGVLIVALLVVIIVLAMKLSRKADYEQYEYNYYDGAPEEKSEKKKRKDKKNKKKSKGKDKGNKEDYPAEPEEQPQDGAYDGEYDGYEGDDAYAEGDGAAYADDGYDAQEDDGVYEEEDYGEPAEEGYDNDNDFDDSFPDRGYEEKPKKKTGKYSKGKDKDGDDFPIDFIEL